MAFDAAYEVFGDVVAICSFLRNTRPSRRRMRSHYADFCRGADPNRTDMFVEGATLLFHLKRGKTKQAFCIQVSYLRAQVTDRSWIPPCD
jgi:hypothetical protein